MLLSPTEEIIYHFVGMRLTAYLDQWVDPELEGDTLAARDLILSKVGTLGDVHVEGFIESRLSDWTIAFENDRFDIVPAFTKRIAGPEQIEVNVHAVRAYGHPHHSISSPPMPEPSNGSPEYGYEMLHKSGTLGSILSVYEQSAFLDDRDILTMGGADETAATFIDSIAQSFREMVAAEPQFTPVPEKPDTIEALRSDLTLSSEGAGRDPALAEHAGSYLNGVQIDPEEVPQTGKLIQAMRDMFAREDGGATLSTGNNVVVAETLLSNYSMLAPVSVVLGDWHETNSISQVILRSGTEVSVGGVETLADTAYNHASFERIDRMADIEVSKGTFPFPVTYTVETVHADLKIVNYMVQMHTVFDGDSVVLSAVDHEATFTVGGNSSLTTFDVTDLLGSYDIVVIGGSVFEGNYLRQIAVLSDTDWIDSPIGRGLSAKTGGNLVANDGAIINYGTLDFSSMGEDMRDLVNRVTTGQPAGEGTGPALSFLGHSDLKVLFLDGDVYELNVVDQVSILDDSDSLQVAGRLADGLSQDRFLDWRISTGENAVVNSATILDVDDVAVDRYLDGSYYSQSMLAQAELVADTLEDVRQFDTSKLVPEIVAFTTMDDESDEEHSPQHHWSASDFAAGHYDGLSGMTA
ncbi:hypothetical protein SAMN06297251_1166 [Fulvimarina manganoxydans]|uniref:Uncharacterized protein n=1 Tax=Fulvimarina manganoxydans TaxID=937218 RepID=A0A1W2DL88_9HYPH|nr:hypothetical protein [Fulvimarina manganoxydans]SMC98294.1 hypothetical protein SAMN06297251_1166 [Fulvimarina manganoxydans]